MPKPRFTAQQLGDYISQCKANGGAVTINLGIYQDGSVDPNAVDVLKEVHKRVAAMKLASGPKSAPPDKAGAARKTRPCKAERRTGIPRQRNPPNPPSTRTAPSISMAPFRAKRWKTIWIVQSPWAISWFPASRRATSFRIGMMMSA